MRILITLSIILFGLTAGNSQSINEFVVTPRLIDRFEAQPASTQRVYMLLADQVDVLGLEQRLKAENHSIAERAKLVNMALRAKAASTQPDMIARLSQVPGVAAGTIDSYWVSNILFLDTDLAGLATISQWPEIEIIDWNAPLEKEKVTDEGPAPVLQPNSTEPGLLAIAADFMWDMGYTGYGTVAFTSDTGVDPNQPAISGHWRGHVETAQNSWFNNGSGTLPFDCDDHGTHVTGTIVGLDRLTNDTIGVAFNAQWAGAAILCGIGTQDNIEAFQWAIDPDDNPDTTEDMPDAVNNSWRDPGIGNDCNNVYVPILNALEVAGVAVIFSAGNDGPGATTITPPKYINTDLVNTFSIGALNGNSSSLSIADFSSRGPSICGGDSSLLIKPEVSAPGVSVRSCVPGGYSNFSGTSMAAPHTTGALLLLKEAFPYLSGTDLKLALYFSAIDLGEPGEDNVYGMGIINLENAFNYLLGEGYVPVSPLVDHDAHLIRIQSSNPTCNEGAFVQLWLENGGQEPLTSAEITVTLGDVTVTESWTGNLATGQRTNFEVGPINAEPGFLNLVARVDLPNGQPDQRPLNDQKIDRIGVIDRQPLALYQAAEGTAICAEGSTVVYSEYDGNGEVQIEWFNQLNGGNSIGAGNPFLVEALTETTTLFAEATYSEPLGKASPEDGDIGEEEEGSLRGLIFDALTGFRLKTVWVDAPTIGGRIIRLQNANGDVLGEKIILISEPGWQEIILNMLVPPGFGHELVLESGAPFTYNMTGGGFPYEIDNVVLLERSNFPNNGNALNRYYYFYDWTVEYEELCGRTPITVTVNAGTSESTAAFSLPTNTFDLAQGTAVVAPTNNSTGATTYFWDFGDGNTSEEENPSYEYTEAGSYWITLTAFDQNGCSNATTQEVIVENNVVSSLTEVGFGANADFDVFPNPAGREINLAWKQIPTDEVFVELVDVRGQVLRSWNFAQVSDRVVLELPTASSGVYFMQVRAGENTWVQRLVINQ